VLHETSTHGPLSGRWVLCGTSGETNVGEVQWSLILGAQDGTSASLNSELPLATFPGDPVATFLVWIKDTVGVSASDDLTGLLQSNSEVSVLTNAEFIHGGDGSWHGGESEAGVRASLNFELQTALQGDVLVNPVVAVVLLWGASHVPSLTLPCWAHEFVEVTNLVHTSLVWSTTKLAVVTLAGCSATSGTSLGSI